MGTPANLLHDLHDLRELRARVEQACEDSVRLADSVRSACALNHASREELHANRERWRAWRAALAERSAHGGPLRVCTRCDAVSVRPPERDGADVSEAWFEPPDRVREQLRAGPVGLSVTHALCPACAASLREEPDADTLGAAPGADWSADAAAALLGALADLDVAMAALGVREPWADALTALEDAERLLLERMDRGVDPDDLAALAEALRALVARLHARPVARSSGAHFRPPFRGR